ncbi:flagellar alpha dynein [Microcoleus sp. herbarium2]|uniref:flagellar alpha dynein n=1 Tax=Microcoleus sp. herbarium2 TaxID=3055433 RepID=UPI002FCFEA20
MPDNLTKKNEPRDTADNSDDSEVEKKQCQLRDTSGSIDEVKRLKSECKRLQNLVSDMRIELYHTPPPEIELPEAADLLNRLKAKRKKSTATLADIEAILEMIEG